MVKNSTNIIKKNNYLSPQIIEHRKKIAIRNQGPALGQAQKCNWVKLQYKYKHTIRKKTAQIRLQSKRPYAFTNMNKNINKDVTLAE